ncbi:hypothetical protein GOQ30_09445 [Flavobacterium sp. TP390]|uniref:Uncharacterized protein n=1 Tax=Flavobacterium profundi TaxID=1774945 RepID=A0A6I4ILN3_9FLAO|nr:hypothetical protein [Flavobacterium profundi]MVO09381.1 hypothetical protein [Flavobacterium profundi]
MMKILKYVLVLFFFSGVLYLAFYTPDTVNIEGNWDLDELVLQGEKIYSAKKENQLFPKEYNKVYVNEWKDSLHIESVLNKEITATYKTKRGNKGNHMIYLISDEKALNGDFSLHVDTIFYDKVRFQIKFSIQSEATILKFSRNVLTTPWKPQYPFRGCV